MDLERLLKTVKSFSGEKFRVWARGMHKGYS